MAGRMAGRADGSARPLPSRPDCYFFFLPFLLFLSFLLLPFFAIRITPLPDPEGQRYVDQTSTYH
jgi:hypothetical protein